MPEVKIARGLIIGPFNSNHIGGHSDIRDQLVVRLIMTKGGWFGLAPLQSTVGAACDCEGRN